MSNTEQTTDIDVDSSLSAAQLLEKALFGDTADTTAEQGGEPSTTQAADTTTSTAAAVPVAEGQGTPAAESTTQAAEPTPENTVVMAKDGVHTIPYETLQEARDQSQQWKTQALQAQEQARQAQEALTALQNAQSSATTTQAQSNAETAQAAIEASGNSQAVMELFGDFSEEAIAKGVQALIAQQVPNQIQVAINQALAPLQQQQQLTAQQSAEAAHFAAIHAKYPEAGAIAESEQFKAWLGQQHPLHQKAYETVLGQGSAAEVVGLLDLYTQTSNVGQAATPSITDEMKEKAKQAVQNAPPKIPHSVTDLPASTPAAVSAEERLNNLSSHELLREMENWSPEQIDAFNARRG